MSDKGDKSSKLSWTQYAMVAGILALNVAIIYGLVRLTPAGETLKEWEARTFSQSNIDEIKGAVKKLKDEAAASVDELKSKISK